MNIVDNSFYCLFEIRIVNYAYNIIMHIFFYDVLEKAVPNFSTLNDEQKYMYILSSEELSILNLVAKFIKENI
jgi:hypothetical protein